MLVIGDIHGKMNSYKELIENSLDSLNLGDVGFRKEHEWILNNIDVSNHKTLFGNHDDTTYINSPHSLGKFGLTKSPKTNIEYYFIKGAWSIDYYRRIEGRDFFRDEELETLEFFKAYDEIMDVKPSIIISHDCPSIISKKFYGIDAKSKTSIALNNIFMDYQPDLWVFGHHHKSKTEIVNGTKFICLKELETLKI